MLHGKTAIVTGASRGIGRAIAETFAKNGASLVLVAREQDELQHAANVVRKNGGRVETLLADVAIPETAKQAVSLAYCFGGGVDVLVNCAGIITRTPFEELSLEEWHSVINVNLHGTFHMCQAVLPMMREAGAGRVINITSQMAKLPHPSAAPSYEVSKAGMVALTRHLALQYAKYNVLVNGIAPGSINTRMPKSMSDEARERLRKGIPMQRLGEPEEVADCVLFLASSLSTYITGEIIDVNGGSLMD